MEDLRKKYLCRSHYRAQRSSIPSPQLTRKRRTASSSAPIKKLCVTFVPFVLMHPCTTSGTTNTVEKTSTGVNPAELILNNSICISARILAPPGSNTPGSQVVLSDTLDSWVARQHTLLTLAQAHQIQADSHLLVEYDPPITEYPIHSYMLFVALVGRSNKLLPKYRGPFQLMDKTDSIYTIKDLVSGKRITTHIHNRRPFIYDISQMQFTWKRTCIHMQTNRQRKGYWVGYFGTWSVR